MKWYWWALIALGIVLVIWALISTSKKNKAIVASLNNGVLSNPFNPYDLVKIT